MALQHGHDQAVRFRRIVSRARSACEPHGQRGWSFFAHGSGSSRFSPRNTFVANALRQAGLATLLFDLLTEPEAADRANVFDIPLLAERLVAATDLSEGPRSPARSPSATSARAPAPPPPWSLPRSAAMSPPLCRAAAAPISPARRWPTSGHRPC